MDNVKNNIEDTRLSYILEIVKQLNLRFPGAEITEKTGFNKGQVSSYT